VKTRLRSRLARLAGALVLLAPAIAGAQDPAPVPGEQQNVALPSEEKASDDEAHARAVRAFQQSGDAADAEAVGLAAARLGRHREAAEHFAIALSLLPVTKTDDRARIQGALKAEKAFVATVVVELVPDGVATILVDGIAVGTYPLKLPLYLDAGEHSFAVVAEEKRYASVRAKVEVGKAFTVRLREASSVATAPPKPVWPGIVLGSLGGAALVVGVATLVVSFARESDAEERGEAIGTCNLDALGNDCLELSGLVADRNALRNASTIAFVASGVLAAATLAYVFIPLPSGPDEKPVASLGVGPLGDGFGLSLGGTFR
jgi:hypothetical protein